MKASMTQEEGRVTPHPASRRALQDELAILKAERDVQDARLAKAGADLAEQHASLVAAWAREADLECIAAHRLDELVKARARVLELEREAQKIHGCEGGACSGE